jgi:ammonium transporter Rh
VFWPSFNSGPVSDSPDFQRIAIVNTYFALAACVCGAFVASSLVEKKFRFNMVHIQNATIAGGVAVGTCADLSIEPWGAALIGLLAGFLSVLGYAYISPAMSKNLNIHDTCGVHNLHGMPAVFAGLAGAIAAAAISKPLKGTYGKVDDGKRSLGEQAGYQFAGVCVSFAIAVIGGLITGAIIKPFNRPYEDLYNDEPEWLIPEDHGEDTTGRLESKPKSGDMVLQNTTIATQQL